MQSVEEKLKLIKADAVLFAKHILGFTPFPYQEKLLRDNSKRIVACMGRQTGKSTTVAAKAVWFACTHPNTNTLIVSATLRQSMLMMDKVLGFIESSTHLKKSISYKARTRVRFRNGSWIIALPCGRYGHTLRGHTAHLVILDEAAFIPEEVITNVVLPMVSTTDGYVWMLSTPWDKEHIFYKAFSDVKGWSVYHLPSRVNPLISRSFLEEQRQLIGEERFKMEYEAEFIDDARSYFPMTLLRSACEDYEPTVDGVLFCGYDPGGKMDYAAFVAVKRVNSELRVACVKAAKNLSYTDFDASLLELYRQRPFRRLLVDQTGLGAPIVEHLKELGLPAEGLTLTDKVKEELFSNLKIQLEQKTLILHYNTMLLHHLNSVVFERTRSGGFRFYSSEGSHDDLAYALALACCAAKDERGAAAKVEEKIK